MPLNRARLRRNQTLTSESLLPIRIRIPLTLLPRAQSSPAPLRRIRRGANPLESAAPWPAGSST